MSCWHGSGPGSSIEENNLQVQISALRKALDEDKSGQSYLVTVRAAATA